MQFYILLVLLMSLGTAQIFGAEQLAAAIRAASPEQLAAIKTNRANLRLMGDPRVQAALEEKAGKRQPAPGGQQPGGQQPGGQQPGGQQQQGGGINLSAVEDQARQVKTASQAVITAIDGAKFQGKEADQIAEAGGFKLADQVKLAQAITDAKTSYEVMKAVMQ